MLASVRAALDAVNSQGVTTIFGAGSGEADLAAFRTLYDTGELTVRSVFAITFSPEEAADPAAAVATIRQHAASFGLSGTATMPGITIDRAKIFVDGVIQAPAQTGCVEVVTCVKPGEQPCRPRQSWHAVDVDEPLVVAVREAVVKRRAA